MIIMIITGPCQRAVKAVKHESDGNSNHSWVPYIAPQKPGKMTPITGD